MTYTYKLNDLLNEVQFYEIGSKYSCQLLLDTFNLKNTQY